MNDFEYDSDGLKFTRLINLFIYIKYFRFRILFGVHEWPLNLMLNMYLDIIYIVEDYVSRLGIKITSVRF